MKFDEKMRVENAKRVLHPSYLSVRMFFKSWGQFFWAELYNLAVLFAVVYVVQQCLGLHKLQLWLYWACCVAYRKLAAGAFCCPSHRLNGHTIVITGADSGIGKQVARELALLGAHLVLASRDLEKAEQTKKELMDIKGSIEIRHMDLASLESVRAFANGIIHHKYHLHMLINVAGEMMTPEGETVDGLERQMAVNHLGRFLLTQLLLPWLTHHRPARIINVGATAHIAGVVPLGESVYRAPDRWQAYCNSQLATLLFTKQLAHNVKDTNVQVFCANPGVTSTALWRHVLPAAVYESSVWNFLLQTPKEAAQTILHCCTEASSKDQSYYYSECSPGWPSAAAEDSDLAARWWGRSEQLVSQARTPS